jgi:hypothetical protein
MKRYWRLVGQFHKLLLGAPAEAIKEEDGVDMVGDTGQDLLVVRMDVAPVMQAFRVQPQQDGEVPFPRMDAFVRVHRYKILQDRPLAGLVGEPLAFRVVHHEHILDILVTADQLNDLVR